MTMLGKRVEGGIDYSPEVEKTENILREALLKAGMVETKSPRPGTKAFDRVRDAAYGYIQLLIL